MNKVQGGLRRTFPKIFFLREKSCESCGGCNKIWLAIAHGLSDSHQALLLLPPPVCCWVYTSDPVGWVGGWGEGGVGVMSGESRYGFGLKIL